MMDWIPKERTAFIYALWGPNDECLYIGSTYNPKNRFSHHPYRKLGTFSIIDEVSWRERYAYEYSYIRLALDCCEPLLNKEHSIIPIGMPTVKHAEHQINKFTAIRKEHKSYRCGCRNWYLTKKAMTASAERQEEKA